METELVIVRNAYGRALRRMVFDASHETVLVVSEQNQDSADTGLTSAIGVPPGGVFEMNEAVLDSLEDEWNQNGSTTPETWRRLTRSRPQLR